MGKSKAKNYKTLSAETPKPNEHFTRLHDSLIKSVPYKKLSHSARTVYTILKSEFKGWATGNNIICPYRLFNEYGLNNMTIAKALRELEEAGFIEIERQGVTVNKNLHHKAPTVYHLSNKWYMDKPP